MYKGKKLAKPKDKNDQRSDTDRLLDYLVHLNAKDPDYKNLEKGGWMKMAFDEGFGGMAGADKDYWRLRIKEETARHRSTHNSIKPGLSYKRDLETEGRIAALERAAKSGKITDDERAEYEALKDVKKKADATDLKDVFRTPDTTVFTHFNEKVRTFFELGGYRAFPEVVSVHVEVREVFAVDVSRGTFRVSFIATTRWYDQFFDKSEYFDKEEMYSQTRPYITFDHVDEGDNPDGVPPDAANLQDEEKHHGKCLHKPTDPPGVLYHSQRVQCSFRAYNNLRPFPFDVQHLPITMRLWGSNQKGNPDHGRILLPLTMNLKLAHQHLEWHAYHAISYGTKGRFDRQDLTMALCLKRRPMFFVQNVYFILAMMPTMGFFAFAVPEDDAGSFVDSYEARCQVTLTLILTSIAYKFYLEGMLPKAPYLSRLDTFIYGSFMFNAAILFANTVVMVVEKYPPSTATGETIRDVLVQYDGEEDVPYQVTLDRIFFYVLFIAWIVYIWYSRHLALKDHKALGDKDSGGRLRVASDVDDTEVKIHKKKLEQKETWRGRIYHYFVPIKANDTNFKSLKRLYPHLKRWKELKAAQKNEIVDHRRGLQTVHQRRYDHVAKLRKLEGSNKLTIKPKGTPSAWHCTCEACENRRPQADETGPAIEKLESLFREAGIELYMITELRRQFMNYEIDRDDLERVFNNGLGADAVDRMLDTIDVKVNLRVKLIAALSQPKQLSTDNKMGERILAMQGSSSYLWLALKDGALGYAGKGDASLAGMLIKTVDFKQRLTDELNRIINQPDERHNLGNTANVIMANTVFQSPMLASEYVYSQRKFDAAHEKKGWSLPSQVWLGYLDNLKQTEWEITKKGGNGAIAVDVGTGKMAFGYAEKRFEDEFITDKNKVQKKDKYGQSVVVKKSIVRAIDLADFELNDNVEEFFDNLRTTVEYMDVRTAKYPETVGEPLDPEHQKSDFDHLRDATSSIIDELVNVRLYLIHVKGIELSKTAPIFLFGTSKLRLWIKELEQKHGGRCTELIEGIGQLMEWMMPQRVENTSAIKIVGCGSTDKSASEQEKAFADFNGVYLDESTMVGGIKVVCWRKMRSTVTIEMRDGNVWTMSKGEDRTVGFQSRVAGASTSDGQVYVPPTKGWACSAATPRTGRPTLTTIKGESDTAHPIKFEVLSQDREAKAELRAFQLSLEHGKVNEHREKQQAVIKEKLAQNLVGNIAWGNGSMQGAPDGAVTIDAEMGMNVCKGILQKEIKDGGGKIIPKYDKKKMKDVPDAFSFPDIATARAVIEKARKKTMAKLHTLAPRMPTPDPQKLDPLPTDWDASKLTFLALQKPKDAKPGSGPKKEAAAAAVTDGKQRRLEGYTGFGEDPASSSGSAIGFSTGSRTASHTASFTQEDLFF
jgi:hypothetical protein